MVCSRTYHANEVIVGDDTNSEFLYSAYTMLCVLHTHYHWSLDLFHRDSAICYSNYNFCTIMAISRQKEVGTMPISYRMTSRVLYSAQYHRQHCTLQAFEQFEALYIHNIDDKCLTRPGFKPSTFEFRATTGSNEPSGPAIL